MRRAYTRFNRHDGQAMAGYIAFSALLGMFPFIILATNMGAQIIGPGRSQSVIDALFDFAPSHVAQTVEPVLRDVLSGASGGLLTVSAIVALWFSSNVFEALRVAFDRAYREGDGRHWIKGRLVSILCVILGLITALILGGVIVFAPLAINLITSWTQMDIPFGINMLRYPIGIAVFIGFLMYLHKVLPGHALAIRQLWPGVLVSTFVWLVAAIGFSIYLGLTPTYSSTYGAMAGVVITLMFFYISGLAIIYGAELNAIVAQQT